MHFSIKFFQHSQRFLFSSNQSLIKSLKNTKNIDPIYLLTYITSYPNIVKHQEFKLILKYTIYESQEARRQFTIPELFLIRMLLSYSKFSNSDYDWKGVISKVLKKFEEKDLNLYDLGLIMSLYYDGLRRFFEIKGKEQDFFPVKKILFEREKEYNMALSLNFRNLYEYISIKRGKIMEETFYYELILARVFERIENDKLNLEEILYFYKIFIGFQFKHEKFDKFMYDNLKNQKISLSDFTEIYIIYFRKHYLGFLDIFNDFISKFQETLKSSQTIEISFTNEQHYLYLQPTYLKTLLGETIKLDESLKQTQEFLTNRNILDVYWMLSRNYYPKNNEFLLDLEKKLENLLETFQLKDLILLLISKIYHFIVKEQQKPSKLDDILTKISEKIETDPDCLEILNTKTVSGNLFLSLKYLEFFGYQRLISEKFDKETLLFLKKQWIYSSRNQKNSNSEKIIRENLKQVLQKTDVFPYKSMKFQILLADIYYCDILVGDKYVIEINGNQHYNVFYGNKEVLDRKFQFTGNFLLKKEILKKNGYIVTEINEETYLKFLYNKEKLHAFLEDFLKVLKTSSNLRF